TSFIFFVLFFLFGGGVCLTTNFWSLGGGFFGPPPPPPPNPSIAPVVEQKPTPTPTDIPYGASHKEWAQMATLVGRDMVGRGVEKGYLTPEELRDVINTYLQTAMEAAEDCELTTIELMGFVDVYAEMVDDAGVSEKLNISSRWDLLSALVDRRIPGFNCEENIQLRAQWIIDEYGD
ncbi:MAG: hypothetical protein OXH93_11245, partial [Caldilineaceae bacterium]|nr:hypothetical protein [Caldilineaceae bacterium]MDE0462980.1 hypothetical protein [Caldilineaceae bacterium]